jgi:hypothetical protein
MEHAGGVCYHCYADINDDGSATVHCFYR